MEGVRKEVVAPLLGSTLAQNHAGTGVVPLSVRARSLSPLFDDDVFLWGCHDVGLLNPNFKQHPS